MGKTMRCRGLMDSISRREAESKTVCGPSHELLDKTARDPHLVHAQIGTVVPDALNEGCAADRSRYVISVGLTEIGLGCFRSAHSQPLVRRKKSFASRFAPERTQK